MSASAAKRIARVISCAEITEGVLFELGIYPLPSPTRIYIYRGSGVLPALPAALGSLTLDGPTITVSLDTNGHCTILDLLLAARDAGIEEGKRQAQADVRAALGLT
jgi:hypothetical protein